jgi:hypothetical protein
MVIDGRLLRASFSPRLRQGNSAHQPWGTGAGAKPTLDALTISSPEQLHVHDLPYAGKEILNNSIKSDGSERSSYGVEFISSIQWWFIGFCVKKFTQSHRMNT